MPETALLRSNGYTSLLNVFRASFLADNRSSPYALHLRTGAGFLFWSYCPGSDSRRNLSATGRIYI